MFYFLFFRFFSSPSLLAPSYYPSYYPSPLLSSIPPFWLIMVITHFSMCTFNTAVSLYPHHTHTHVSPFCHWPSLCSFITSFHLHPLPLFFLHVTSPPLVLQLLSSLLTHSLPVSSPVPPPPPHLSGEPAASGNPSFAGWQPGGTLPTPLWERTSWRPRAWWTGPSSCWSDTVRHPGTVTTQVNYKEKERKPKCEVNIYWI